MKKQKKLIKKLSFLVAILILILLALISINLNFEGFVKSIFRSSELIVIKDNCGVVMDNLIHEIKSEDVCRIRCINECVLLEKSIDRVEFIENESSCYKCNCYCK